MMMSVVDRYVYMRVMRDGYSWSWISLFLRLKGLTSEEEYDQLAGPDCTHAESR
jgi:hypothetical protein